MQKSNIELRSCLGCSRVDIQCFKYEIDSIPEDKRPILIFLPMAKLKTSILTEYYQIIDPYKKLFWVFPLRLVNY
jgi:hypothetical protein